jgi:quinolinate synthase
VEKSDAKRYIIGTEIGIIHSLNKRNPAAEYIPASERALCQNMKKITLDKIVTSMERLQYKIEVEEEIRVKAKKSLDRMIEVLPVR